MTLLPRSLAIEPILLRLPFSSSVVFYLINSLLLDLIFPRNCLGCRHSGHYFCPNCLSQLSPLSARVPQKPFEGQLSLFKYQFLIRTAILELKFKFVTDLVDELSDLIVATLCRDYPNIVAYWQNNHFTLIPVPLHPRRQNWRGFNQSELLGQKLSQHLQITFTNKHLFRTKFVSPQTSLKNKTQRLRNPRDSFCLVFPAPANVILFDDVFTTGATLNVAAANFPPVTKLWSLTIAG